MNKEQLSSSPERKEGEIISQLSSVVILRDGRLAFIGWTASGTPVVVRNETQLSPEMKQSFAAYNKARLKLRKITSGSIDAYNYYYTGTTFDYPENADDLVTLWVKNAKDEVENVLLSEQEALESIVEAKNCWQTVDPQDANDRQVSAHSMFTLFLPDNDDLYKKQAVLFKPEIKTEGNETPFTVFVCGILEKLLRMNAKRYSGAIESLQEYENTQSTANFYLKLRKLGLISFRNEELQSIAREAGLLRKLEKFGIIKINQGKQGEFTPEVKARLEKLTIAQLFQITETMLEVF